MRDFHLRRRLERIEKRLGKGSPPRPLTLFDLLAGTVDYPVDPEDPLLKLLESIPEETEEEE